MQELALFMGCFLVICTQFFKKKKEFEAESRQSLLALRVRLFLSFWRGGKCMDERNGRNQQKSIVESPALNIHHTLCTTSAVVVFFRVYSYSVFTLT